MTDKIKKFLRKLTKKQLTYLIPYVDRISLNELTGLNIKPLKGHKGLYRARVGKYRIVYRLKDHDSTDILFVGKRDDQTYRDF